MTKRMSGMISRYMYLHVRATSEYLDEVVTVDIVLVH